MFQAAAGSRTRSDWKQEAAMQHVPCGLCGGHDEQLLHVKQVPDGDRPTAYRVVRCNACGLVYVNPRQQEEYVTEIYRDAGYFSRAEDSTTGYSHYVADKDLHVLFFQEQLTALESRIPRGRLLDVGCAYGFLLEAAARRGWQPRGVELSADAAEHVRREFGLPVFNGKLRDARFADAEFDAVVMNDVIEHMTDPLAELREVQRLLRSGGMVMLHTPNEASPWHWLMGSRWIHLKPAEHLYYFSPATLSEMLRRAGFEVLYARPRAKMTNAAYIAGVLGKMSPTLGRGLAWVAERMPLMKWPFPFRGGGFEVLARKVSAGE